jgi:hypothetical protein
VDKKKNAQGLRALKTPPHADPPPSTSTAMAPLLQKIIAQYATTGLPPAYLPKPDSNSNPS